MRELSRIQHGHLIKSVHNDELGVEYHAVMELAKDSPQTVLKARGNDRELSEQLKKFENGGGKAKWETVIEASTLAQAHKIAKTRMMLAELSMEERQEFMRGIYPLVSEDPEQTDSNTEE